MSTSEGDLSESGSGKGRQGRRECALKRCRAAPSWFGSRRWVEILLTLNSPCIGSQSIPSGTEGIALSKSLPHSSDGTRN